ncbi:MAG: hypothetical protein DRQ10_01030 [Candidatus Hydrothermota bacterium]|nr:MAG: hypothetical protein DRQ10_01030 [Candidatus Hydrothermae bacterium]
MQSRRKKKWFTRERKMKLGAYTIDMSKVLVAGYLLKLLTGEKKGVWWHFVIGIFAWGILLLLGLHFSSPKE